MRTTLVTYASGYKAYYQRDKSPRCPYLRSHRGCDEHEVFALLHRGKDTGDPENPEQWWWPRTPDFLAEASKHSKTPVGVSTMDGLIACIGRKQGLDEVMWFGHGATGELQFGKGGRLPAAGIVRLPDISKHFAPGGFIVFYACNTGNSEEYLQSLANTLKVKVKGFSKGVLWNLHWDPEGPPHRLITSRGIDGKLPKPDQEKTPS